MADMTRGWADRDRAVQGLIWRYGVFQHYDTRAEGQRLEQFEMIVELLHSAASKMFETTYFGKLFIRLE